MVWQLIDAFLIDTPVINASSPLRSRGIMLFASDLFTKTQKTNAIVFVLVNETFTSCWEIIA